MCYWWNSTKYMLYFNFTLRSLANASLCYKPKCPYVPVWCISSCLNTFIAKPQFFIVASKRSHICSSLHVSSCVQGEAPDWVITCSYDSITTCSHLRDTNAWMSVVLQNTTKMQKGSYISLHFPFHYTYSFFFHPTPSTSSLSRQIATIIDVKISGEKLGFNPN